MLEFKKTFSLCCEKYNDCSRDRYETKENFKKNLWMMNASPNEISPVLKYDLRGFTILIKYFRLKTTN